LIENLETCGAWGFSVDNQKSTILHFRTPLLYFWILFNAFALGMLVLDQRVFHRPGQVSSSRAALGWSGMYVALAALFAVVVYFWQ
jgi:hypothetical protein